MTTWNDIYQVPVRPYINYPHITHHQAVMKIALSIADIFEQIHRIKVNKDILITAGLLIDVSKLVEYQPTDNGKIELSKLGKMYPHAFMGAHFALKHGIDHQICEIILNHTPDSTRFPESLEGKILYYADQLDVISFYKDRWHKETKVYLKHN